MSKYPEVIPPWEDVREEFEFLWNEYALCPDSRLSHDAISLKRNLINLGLDIADSPTLEELCSQITPENKEPLIDF